MKTNEIINRLLKQRAENIVNEWSPKYDYDYDYSIGMLAGMRTVFALSGNEEMEKFINDKLNNLNDKHMDVLKRREELAYASI
jgi:hypothetical protein